MGKGNPDPKQESLLKGEEPLLDMKAVRRSMQTIFASMGSESAKARLQADRIAESISVPRLPQPKVDQPITCSNCGLPVVWVDGRWVGALNGRSVCTDLSLVRHTVDPQHLIQP